MSEINLQPLFQWFEATAIGTTVRQSLWMFPIIECIHLLALAMLGGAVLAVDLRLLGLGLRSQSCASLQRSLQPLLVGSLVMIIATGIPMFLSEAIKCYYSPPFFFKIGLLVVATVFTFTIRRSFANKETEGGFITRLTAVASLALWFSVGFAGRWIAFY